MRRLVAPLTTAACFAALLAALGIVGLFVVHPLVTGGKALGVLTGSMTPTIPQGSLVFITPVEPSDYEVGDVITFTPTGSSFFVTHRITEVRDGGTTLITQGDANDVVDPPVPATAVEGRVWLDVPRLGSLTQWVKSPAGTRTILFVGLGAMVFLQLGRFVLRRPKDIPVTSSPAEQPPAAAGTTHGSGGTLLLATLPRTAVGRGTASDLAEVLQGMVVEDLPDRVVLAFARTPASSAALCEVLVSLGGGSTQLQHAPLPCWTAAPEADETGPGVEPGQQRTSSDPEVTPPAHSSIDAVGAPRPQTTLTRLRDRIADRRRSLDGVRAVLAPADEAVREPSPPAERAPEVTADEGALATEDAQHRVPA